MSSTNKEQEELWNGRLGKGFLYAGDYIDRLVSPFTQKVIEAVNPKPDDRILDVGCGGGSTTLLLAEAGADIRGIDISKKMISSAKNRSKNFSNISIERKDNILNNFYKKILNNHNAKVLFLCFDKKNKKAQNYYKRNNFAFLHKVKNLIYLKKDFYK